MSFSMPYVNTRKTNLSEYWYALAKITHEDWRLRTCPPYDSSDWIKFFHNIILRELYRDRRWRVPLPTAWGMPHTTSTRFEEYEKVLLPVVRSMIESGIFMSELKDD